LIFLNVLQPILQILFWAFPKLEIHLFSNRFT